MRKKNELIEIKSEVKVGDIILEKGDKIRLINEQLKPMDIETFKSVIEKYTVGATEYNIGSGKGTYIKFDKPFKIDWYETKNMGHFYYGTKSFEVGIAWNDIDQIEQYDEVNDDVIVLTSSGMYFYFAVKAKQLSFI